MNPLMQSMGAPAGNPQVMQSIRNMMRMVQGAQNPQAVMQMLTQQNPMVAQVMQMAGGGSLKDTFYEMCKAQGVNPDDILNQLK